MTRESLHDCICISLCSDLMKIFFWQKSPKEIEGIFYSEAQLASTSLIMSKLLLEC